MSVFDRLDRIASATVDRLNAAAFVLTPVMKLPNGRPVGDPGRTVINGYGVFDLVDVDPSIEVGNRDRRGNDFRTLIADPKPVLSVDRRHFPLSIDQPQQGDRVTVAGQAGAFEVTSVRRDGQARVELHLARLP